VIARVTISLIVKPLTIEYVRTSRTTLAGIFSVIGTEGATIGTAWPIACASCTYRYAWRRDRPNYRDSNTTASAMPVPRASKLCAAFSRSAF
jgi:hypothetical protein